MYDNNEYMNNHKSVNYLKYIIIIVIIIIILFFIKFFIIKNKDLKINYDIDVYKITNQDVTIYYEVIGSSFSKVEFSDGTTSSNNKGTYQIKENGTYKLKAYNTDGDIYEQEIIISNIDKELPKGSCEATLTNKDTKIIIEVTDNNTIIKYDYYDNDNLLVSSLSSEYTYNKKTSENISIKAYDEAGNISDIKCNVINNAYFEPIKPETSDRVVFTGETDTLKAYIIQRSGYYLTRIWAIDPYMQLNKAVSSEYGVKMYSPKNLMNKALTNNNLQDKLVISFNTSGFYLKDTYDASSVTAYPAYDKTSVGTIVINNGQLVRNVYNHAIKQWYITGITKDNKMVIFEDNKAKTADEIVEKQKWAQTVIDSGIRNTFTFAGPVIMNGQRLTKFSSSMPYSDNNAEIGLQLICQINDNNFALFSSSKTTRKNAINVLESIGCQTATNLDGGGSVALMYKEKNSSEFINVIGTGRQMPEVGYFTE